MSNDVTISVENVSKRYRLGQIGVTTLRESVERWMHRLRGRDPQARMGKIGTETSDCRDPFLSESPASGGEIWALRDVSFEVRRGEVLGIVGRNGAGKSTLLKILSSITEPTLGRAVLRGRVGSLLEVGTGFHPDLTGRENTHLNGAILGMKKAEIDRKFDEIVAFAEVEKFVDTPVKRYSSGMYVRLAFAVAAHLEPEILLVDEVLAVGDAGFQKKCLSCFNPKFWRLTRIEQVLNSIFPAYSFHKSSRIIITIYPFLPIIQSNPFDPYFLFILLFFPLFMNSKRLSRSEKIGRSPWFEGEQVAIK